MRNKRIVIYGGTELDPRISNFVTQLAYELLKNDRILLATGGFKQKADSSSSKISTDVATLEGAKKFISERGLLLDSCLETWLPERTKDRKDEKVERFEEGKLEVLPGLSAQARRLRLVQLADAMITVEGYIRTALVLEMAVAIARPALPLAFTGGDSEDHWESNRSYYLGRLGISEELAKKWEKFVVGDVKDESTKTCIAEIIDTVTRVTRRNCLVLMPFADRLTDFYASLHQMIDGEGFHPVRLDRDLYAGDVRETVRRLLRECDAVVADVTDRSANVMYELGLAHAYGREPLLIWRGSAESLEAKAPFYLRPQRIIFGAEPEKIRESLKLYLDSARRGN